MAEQRFPSIEDIGEGQPPSTNGTTHNTNDAPADSDFLARERAVLGDDAAQFAPASVADADGEDDLLGGGGGGGGDDLLGATQGQGGGAGGEEITEFESAFPSVDTRNESVGPGGTITGSDMPYRQPSYGGFAAEEESEPMRQWRERRDLAISEREKISSSKKEDTVKKARTDIDDFYEKYSSKTEKGIQRTRKDAEEFLANRENTTAGGTSWERIAKLVDLSGKGGKAGGAGKDKFREMLLDLRKDGKAPGAGGV